MAVKTWLFIHLYSYGPCFSNSTLFGVSQVFTSLPNPNPRWGRKKVRRERGRRPPSSGWVGSWGSFWGDTNLRISSSPGKQQTSKCSDQSSFLEAFFQSIFYKPSHLLFLRALILSQSPQSPQIFTNHSRQSPHPFSEPMRVLPAGETMPLSKQQEAIYQLWTN